MICHSFLCACTDYIFSDSRWSLEMIIPFLMEYCPIRISSELLFLHILLILSFQNADDLHENLCQRFPLIDIAGGSAHPDYFFLDPVGVLVPSGRENKLECGTEQFPADRFR